MTSMPGEPIMFTIGHSDHELNTFIALLRRHAVAPFRAMLAAVCRDPAMLRYLDNVSNRKQHPNENFARELLELFTMGAGNYTEKLKELKKTLDPNNIMNPGKLCFS